MLKDNLFIKNDTYCYSAIMDFHSIPFPIFSAQAHDADPPVTVPVTVPLGRPSGLSCEPLWTLYESSCYRFFDIDKAFDSAQEVCQLTPNGNLATLHSAKESDWVHTTL